MSWDDEDDAFYAAFDMDSAVRQVRAQQQQERIQCPQQPQRPQASAIVAPAPATRPPPAVPHCVQQQQRLQPTSNAPQATAFPNMAAAPAGRPGVPPVLPAARQQQRQERQQHLQPSGIAAKTGRPGAPPTSIPAAHQQQRLQPAHMAAAPAGRPGVQPTVVLAAQQQQQQPQQPPGSMVVLSRPGLPPAPAQQPPPQQPVAPRLRSLFTGAQSGNIGVEPRSGGGMPAVHPVAGQQQCPPLYQHQHQPQHQSMHRPQHPPVQQPQVQHLPQPPYAQQHHQPHVQPQQQHASHVQQQQPVYGPPHGQQGPPHGQQHQKQTAFEQQVVGPFQQFALPAPGQQQPSALPGLGQQQHQTCPSDHQQQQQHPSGHQQQQQHPSGHQQQQQHPSGHQQQQQHPSGHQQQQHPSGHQQQQHPSGHQQQQQQQHPSGHQQQQQQQHPSGHQQQQVSGPAAGQPSGPLLFVTLELGKDQLIEVKCGYREEVATALRRIPGGEWDARSRYWKFPIIHHDRIVEVLQGVKGVRMKIEQLAPIVSDVLKAAAACPDDSSRYCHIPANLEQQLMPFQREGVKFVLKAGGRALIGDEMGLGKTVQAIAVAAAYRDEWPVLIIAPSSLREGWADALHRWLGITADRMHIVHNGKDAANVPKGINFLICSYNFVQKMDLAKKFGMVICDESHFLKEGTSQRTKATVPLVKEARRALLLSGTPATNKPKELYQQLAALVPRAKIKMAQFGERYCQGNHYDKYGGASNLTELNAVLKNSIMVRRLKREVLTQLPSKRRQQVMLDLDDDAKKQLAGLQRQLEVVRSIMGEETRQNMASGSAAGGGGGSRTEQNTIITALYNKTAEVKAKSVQKYVQLLLDSDTKFLVFGHHTSMLDAIEHTCNRHKIGKQTVKFIRIDGSTPPSKRQSMVNKFQENEDYRVAILSIRAAGTGLTLTAASTVVFAELTWVPGETIQAEDRAHRIGQASSVNVYFLHARGSIDDMIWQSIQNKLDSVGEAIDGEAQALDARRVEAPDQGQKTLAKFMTQSKPADEQQQQQQGRQQQGAQQSRPPEPAGAGDGGKSPSKGQQKSLLSFFANSKQQAEAPPQQKVQPLQGPSGANVQRVGVKRPYADR